MGGNSNIAIVDCGEEVTLCETLFVLQLVAKKMNRTFDVFIEAKYIQLESAILAKNLHLYKIDEHQKNQFKKYKLILDFSPVGCGSLASRALYNQTKYFNLSLDENKIAGSLQSKVDFLESELGCKDILSHLKPPHLPPVLTYSAKLAAFLNLNNIPTLEIVNTKGESGSFLPGSVVVRSESMKSLSKEDLEIIFEFYRLNKINELFMNKCCLDVDWHLIYHHIDSQKSRVKLKTLPVSPMEEFYDHFLRSFISDQPTDKFSLQKLLDISNKMDVIDFDMSLDFLRKNLKLCLEDVEYEEPPFNAIHWNFVRPYLDLGVGPQKLLKMLNQALIGLDLFEKIEERQRRTLGLH